jgi:hypothetical protein
VKAAVLKVSWLPSGQGGDSCEEEYDGSEERSSGGKKAINGIPGLIAI